MNSDKTNIPFNTNTKIPLFAFRKSWGMEFLAQVQNFPICLILYILWLFCFTCIWFHLVLLSLACHNIKPNISYLYFVLTEYLIFCLSDLKCERKSYLHYYNPNIFQFLFFIYFLNSFHCYSWSPLLISLKKNPEIKKQILD